MAAAILDATRRIVFSEGVEAISARRIAKEVGCSAAAIYFHYKSIDDLLHNLRMEGHGVLARFLSEAGTGLAAVERVRAMGRAYYRFGLENAHYYQLMFLSSISDRPTREYIQREVYSLTLLRDAVKEGVDQGAFRKDLDPWVLANVAWSNIHGVTSLAVSGLLFQTAPEHGEEILAGVIESAMRFLKS